jgi:hypothetical protein
MLHDFILGLISSSSRDCFMKMYLILSTLFISWHGHGLVMALYIHRPFSLVPLRWWKSYGGAAFL